jgi:hypothetical protein
MAITACVFQLFEGVIMSSKKLSEANALYDSGQLSLAFELYKQLALDGLLSAQHKIGRMYDSGEGVTQDLAKAAHWYEKAAKEGYIDSQFNLAGLYLHGDGLRKSWDRAYYWYREAARQGDHESQEKLIKINEMSSADEDGNFYFVVDGIDFEDLNGACYQILPELSDSQFKDLIRYLDKKWPQKSSEANNRASCEGFDEPQLSHYWDVLPNEEGNDYLADIYEYVFRELNLSYFS